MTPPDLTSLSPREWLDYQRRLHGYDEAPISADILNKAIEDLPPEAAFLRDLYAPMSKGAFDDRWLQLFWRPMEKLWRPDEWERIRDVYFGMFPTFEVNGYASTTPRGDRVVMIHTALPATVTEWALFALYTIEKKSASADMGTNAELMNFFLWVARAWKKELGAFGAELPKLRPATSDSYMLASVLANSAMVFILGHEAGHLLENHCGYRPSDRAYNHQMEFDADRWGLRACLRHVIADGTAAGDTFIAKFMLLGPYLAMATIATIMDVQGATHPSASQRLERIEDNYETALVELIGKRGLELYKKEMDADFLERTRSIGRNVFTRHARYRDIIEELHRILREVTP